jgi:hypothetical protein
MVKNILRICVFTLGLLIPILVSAQKITTPPSGGNQKAVVTQYMGFVFTTITYSSPDVHSSTGENRTGHIWGELVPYGAKNLNFGSSSAENPSPWRAGANENTTITFSENVLVEGISIPAGTYGLFMEPGEKEWVIIFSKNSNSWGSYYYSKEEDQARVTVMVNESEFNEYLTYEFTERKLESCVAVLKWENIKVEFKISIPDFTNLYISRMRSDLRSDIGFQWNNWVEAANFCLDHQTNLEEALDWATMALEGPYVGEENFTTLQTKGLVLLAMGKEIEAEKYILKAVNHPTASPGKVHQFGRGLIKKGNSKLALNVFKANHKNSNGAWPTNVGLARGYSAVGDYKLAIKYSKRALKIVPDEENKMNLEKALLVLKEGKDIN